MRINVSRLTDILVAVACIVLLMVVLTKQRPRTVELSAAENPIEAGTPLEGHRELENDRTVVLFLHSQCRFCTESMDVYRELKRRSLRAPHGRREFDLKVRGVEPVPVLESYLTAHGIQGVDVESRQNLQG
jgi:hypothetical protein